MTKVDLDHIVSEIIRHRELYFAGTPELSDSEYDRLEDRLRRLEPNHPLLHQVGAFLANDRAKISHQKPMLSLQKIYQLKPLHSWQRGHRKVASYKIDGNALSIQYVHGRFVRAVTRGDGLYGSDVTVAVRCCLKALALDHLHDGDCASLEVRGELYCSRQNFPRLADEMVRRGLPRPTSARNIVAGILGRKDHLDLAQHFSFFAFDLLGPEFLTEIDKLRHLAALGFDLPPHELIAEEHQLERFITDARAFKASDAPYDMDGVVITLNDRAGQMKLGYTSHHPKYRRAFKWNHSFATTTLRKIHWGVGRSGSLTPVGEVEPIVLQPGNARITRLSLHHASHLLNLGLVPGSHIELMRAGDIIPQLVAVKVPSLGPCFLPAQCPACGAATNRDDLASPARRAKVYGGESAWSLVCSRRDSCPEVLTQRIDHWCRVVGIDDLATSRLRQLVQVGALRSTADLYRLEVAALARLEGYQQTLAEKIVRHIRSTMALPAETFLQACGLPHIGPEAARALVAAFSLDQILQLRPDHDLEQVAAVSLPSGRLLGRANASKALASLASERAWIQGMRNIISLTSSSGTGPTSTVLAGLCFCITGALSVPRAQMTARLKSLGATLHSSVTTQTTHLLCNDPKSSSSKLSKAQKNQIPIWSEAQLESFVISRS